jgi:hypothetical protein
MRNNVGRTLLFIGGVLDICTGVINTRLASHLNTELSFGLPFNDRSLTHLGITDQDDVCRSTHLNRRFLIPMISSAKIRDLTPTFLKMMFLYRLSSGISGVKWRRLNITVLKSIELA